MIFANYRSKRDQSGMASFLVSLVLVSLLTAIAIAFAVLMSRELNKSLSNQLSQAAYDAAASGINDAISYVRDNPNTDINQCQDLLGPGKPLNTASNLSGDANATTKYTCALINTKPRDLRYQSIPASQSQVIKTTVASQAGTADSMSKMMVSWQTASQTTSGTNRTPVPSPQYGSLFDETSWSNSDFIPMLRITIYSVPADTKDLSLATNGARTYYLYPTSASGANVTVLSSTDANGLQKVACLTTNSSGNFTPSDAATGFDCSAIISGLPASDINGYITYIRLTPLYSAADVRIQGNDAANQAVNFIGTQAIVDVTAQSSSAVKRLQARVDISALNGPPQTINPGDNNFPEYAVRSADTLCKRLQNPGDPDNLPVYIDDSSLPYCGPELSGLEKLKPPVVSNLSSDNIGQNSASLHGTVNPNKGKATDCYFSVNGNNYSCMGSMPSGRSASNFDVNQDVGGLSAGTGYTFQLCASNPAGQTCQSSSFTTQAPPPSNKQSVHVNLHGSTWDASITDNGDGTGFWHCDFFRSQGGAWLASKYPPDVGYYSAGGATPGGTGYIICYATDGGWGDSQGGGPQPPSVTITYYDVQGPYYNPNVDQRFCPDGFHHYVLCTNWASISQNAGTVSCVEKWRGPNGNSASPSNLPASGGFTFGSNDSSYLINGSLTLTCVGSNGGQDSKIWNAPR